MALSVNQYALTVTPLQKTLPSLLLKVIGSGQRAVVLCKDDEQLKQLNSVMWTFSTIKFLPHGTKEEGYSSEQPVYLTLEEENPNESSVIVPLSKVSNEFLGKFSRCLDIFEVHSTEDVVFANERSDSLYAEFELQRWLQNQKGKWEKQEGSFPV